MRSGVLMVALAAVALSAAGRAQERDVRAERQALLSRVLNVWSVDAVIRIRGSCATGQQPASIAQRRRAGAFELPDAAEYCVIALTRLGRNGTLSHARDPNNSALTPALAFDNGFVTAYKRQGPIASGLPAMSALKPIAEHCLAQAERDLALCESAGNAYGARAAQGEVVQVSRP